MQLEMMPLLLLDLSHSEVRMDTQVQAAPVNPADMMDPTAARKVAENVLSQLGLHPNQQAAKSLLDSHFQGPTAAPEVQAAVKPLVNPVQDETQVQPAQSTATIPIQSSTKDLPLIPQPTAPGQIRSNTDNQTQQDQAEYKRLIDTGSGISQIKNPFLRGLAHAGEIGSDIFVHNLAKVIPGTEAHHQLLVNNQAGMVNNDLKQQANEASIEHEDQQTTNEAQQSANNPNDLSVWIKQNPSKPVTEYWKEKAAAQSGKLTPEQQTMKFLTTPEEAGGQGLDPDEAYQRVKEMAAQAKPKTTSANESEIEGVIAKAMPNGQMDPKIMSDPRSLVSLISNSDQLTDAEKGKVFAHLTAKPSPASQGEIANLRLQGMLLGHLTPAIDTASGNLTLTNPATVNANPGRFVPGQLGSQSMSKEAIFQDIDYNTANVSKALENLHNGFSPKARAQVAYMLSSSDPHSALEKFLKSEVAGTLTPDQVDYVTALQSLNENAMSMRSIAGMGQGSDSMRQAIKDTLPGAETPNKEYAQRQIQLLQGTINRLRTGVPHSGVKPQTEPTSTNQHSTESKTFTKADIEAVAKQYKISYEAAKADAEAHGHKVVE